MKKENLLSREISKLLLEGGRDMGYRKRLFLLIMLDSFIIFISIYMSNFLFLWMEKDTTIVIVSSLLLLAFHNIFANIYGLYRKAWEYASIREVWLIFISVTCSLLTTVAIQMLLFGQSYNRILFVTGLLQLMFIGASRLVWRLFRERLIQTKEFQKNTLIIGAGSGANMLVRQLQKDKHCKLKPVGYLDDDPAKQRLEILGIPILGNISQIEDIVLEKEVSHIIIAIPSLTKTELSDIYAKCSKTKVKTQILPRIEDIAEGKIGVSQLKDISVETLLGRESIVLDNEEVSAKIQGKTVIVTGAGGSIGSEICRQIMNFAPDTIILLGHGENSIYTIEMELLETYAEHDTNIITKIADVQDRNKIFGIMDEYRPDVVYHAAAHKHVPLMEKNPEEAVKNNVLGTKNVAEAASRFGVGIFVMISTDKAVNPTNIMGATKRAAEMIVHSLNYISQTRFVVVRFGNVLGSRGSVIPRFKEQIAKGGPVTVTHPEMIRYFMTIPEASRLVIQAGAFARGGETFVLDMGDPVKIVDLARTLIRLSGFTEEEIEIHFSGIRPGEKLYEELLMNEEGLDATTHQKIFIGKAVHHRYSEVIEKIKILEAVLDDGELVRVKLKEMVPTFVEVHEHKDALLTNEIEGEETTASTPYQLRRANAN